MNDAVRTAISDFLPQFSARDIFAMLLFFGLASFTVVQSNRSNETDRSRECKPFTIGSSAIGGCDWIGK